MHESDARRLHNDLDTMRNILGAELPFETVDVYGTVATGVALLLPAIGSLTGAHSRFLLLCSAVPFLIALVVYMGRNYRAAHPSKPCPAAKRREYRVGLPIFIVISLSLALGFPIWASAAGAPNGVGNACVLILIGMLLLSAGLFDRGRRPALFLAFPAVGVGLLWPFVTVYTLWAAIFSAVGLGMITAGLYMHWQLKSSQKAAAR